MNSETRIAPPRLQAPAIPAVAARLPGLILCAALAAAALAAGRIAWLGAHGLSTLTVAIVLGMLAGNTFYPRWAPLAGSGVGFTRQTVLRAGVILYGLRLTLHDIAAVGLAGLLIDALVLSSTFGLACLLGTRWLGLDRNTALLIGAGSAICGAAAVMATEPVVRGKAEQVTVAVATVVLFGTLAIFLYPALYNLSLHWNWLPQGRHAFGIYTGSTIHEVAQVFAAGNSIDTSTADTAVIAKLVRVMMLAPFLLALSAWLRRGQAQGAKSAAGRLALPWFALGFIGMVGFNSLRLLAQPLVAAAVDADTFLLATAMAALGLGTHAASIRCAGWRPLLLGAMLFAWLVLGGGLINGLVEAWMG